MTDTQPSSPLIYYRVVKEDTKLEKNRFVKQKDGEYKEFTYLDSVRNRVYFKEEDVLSFNLDGHGEYLHFEDSHFTIVHNYLIHFWQPFIKSQGLSLFVTLKSYCYGKDYCYPALATLEAHTGFTKNTLKSWLSKLEEYGFIFRFNRVAAAADKENGKNKKMDDAPLFKVRRKVPFLPKELYNQLPDKLQNAHDKFMKDYMSGYDPDNLANRINYHQIYDEFIESGKLVESKRSIKRVSATNDSIKETMTNEDEFITKAIKEYMEIKLSKPSFETWFKDTLFKLREDVLSAYCLNQFTADWINNRYKDLLHESLVHLDIKILDIKIINIGNE
ncbi:DnaA N-terminal domain-containing protein [Bacillus sp. 1P06AnD]|uniref:helix-turn-helix domain-containing protein n=1 Tax=Bacillus sp. 1P06AnD TaxID=3132208 RepID=UPI0039A3A9F1